MLSFNINELKRQFHHVLGRHSPLNRQLLLAAGEGDMATVTRALEQGADIDCRDEKGMTPLMLSLQAPGIEASLFFLKQGANSLTVNNDGKSFTTLMFEDTAQRAEQRDAILREMTEGTTKRIAIRKPLRFSKQ